MPRLFTNCCCLMRNVTPSSESLPPLAQFPAIWESLPCRCRVLTKQFGISRAAVEFQQPDWRAPWAAYASYELATAMLARGHTEDRHCALELLSNAHSEARTMGMERLTRSIRACAGPHRD